MTDLQSTSITETLRQTFDLAALRIESRALRTGQDWEISTEITDRYEQNLQDAEQRYVHEYEARVQQEYARLIEEARAPDQVHKPIGSRGFYLDQLRIQAQVNVRDAHSNDILAIEKAELRERQDLHDSIARRDERFGDAKQDFARATDRRDGIDRRQVQR